MEAVRLKPYFNGKKGLVTGGDILIEDSKHLDFIQGLSVTDTALNSFCNAIYYTVSANNSEVRHKYFLGAIEYPLAGKDIKVRAVEIIKLLNRMIKEHKRINNA